MPFGIEFAHSLTKHTYSNQDNSKIIEVNKPELSCAAFHYQINQNTVDFSVVFVPSEFEKIQKKIRFIKTLNASTLPHSKLSRAPPFLLYLDC